MFGVIFGVFMFREIWLLVVVEGFFGFVRFLGFVGRGWLFFFCSGKLECESYLGGIGGGDRFGF